MRLIKQVENIINRYSDCARTESGAKMDGLGAEFGGELGAGISGGADSMCLLWLLVRCGLASRLTVLHIDHGLRDTSARDREIVERFCATNSVKIHVFTPNITKMAAENKRSIESEAREQRHKIFLDFANKNNAPIFLAHNLDDNVESILMHIFRGCGLNGLKGMSERDGHLIRPLIGVKKSEIYDFCAQNNIIFGEDETNQDPVYRRNHLRKTIVELEKSFPALKNSVISLSKIATKHQEFVDSALDFTFFSQQDGAVILQKNALKTPISHNYIARALQMAGLKTDVEQKHITAVAALGLDEGKSGKSIDLPHGLKVFNEPTQLAFQIKPRQKCQTAGLSAGKTAEIAETDIQVGQNAIAGSLVTVRESLPTVQKGRILVDADSLIGAKLRTRRDGDRFTPCGGRRKLLSDYLCERKIPQRLRDTLPLIARGGEVLVVADIQLSEHAKLTQKTVKAYEITVEKSQN